MFWQSKDEVWLSNVPLLDQTLAVPPKTYFAIVKVTLGPRKCHFWAKYILALLRHSTVGCRYLLIYEENVKIPKKNAFLPPLIATNPLTSDKKLNQHQYRTKWNKAVLFELVAVNFKFLFCLWTHSTFWIVSILIRTFTLN